MCTIAARVAQISVFLAIFDSFCPAPRRGSHGVPVSAGASPFEKDEIAVGTSATYVSRRFEN
eukprot:4280474-Lingulodinium_polyedra.AAC.1